MALTRTLVTRGFGGLSTPSGPSTPTLTVADNGNNTGATATIASGSAIAANVVYTTPLDGNYTWTNSGNRSGNGTVSLTLDAGIYLAYVESTLNSQEVVSSIVPFVVTTGADAIYMQILEAVQSRIQTLSLTGIASASVLLRKVNTFKGIGVQEASPAIAYPAIVVSPAGTELTATNAGTNERDDTGYAVMVGVVDTDEQALTDNMNRNLLWRERIMHAFRNQRLTGVTEVNACAIEPREPVRFSDWVSGKYVSLLVLRFTAREVRGLGV